MLQYQAADPQLTAYNRAKILLLCPYAKTLTVKLFEGLEFTSRHNTDGNIVQLFAAYGTVIYRI